MSTRAFNAIKPYTLYVFTAMLNFWMIVFYLGFSAGLTNYFPVIALAGAIILFMIASPMLFYKIRLGLLIGLIALLFIFPYSMLFSISLFQDSQFSWDLLIGIIPSMFVLGCIYITVKYFFVRDYFASVKPINRGTKILLSALPPLLFLAYIVGYGRYWNLSNLFKLHGTS